MENEFSFDPDDLIKLNDEMMELYLGGVDYRIETWGRDDEYALYGELTVGADGLCRKVLGDWDSIYGDALRIVFIFGSGSGEKSFSSNYIEIAADISKYGDVYDYEEPRTYNGSPQVQPVSVYYNSMGIDEGIDYTITYKNNINAGEAQVIITGKDKYAGQIVRSFVIDPAAISDTTVSGIADIAYTGKAITPSPVVKLGSMTLKPGTDYTVTYENNKEVGTAAVIIIGKGNLTGTIKKTFKINKAEKPSTITRTDNLLKISSKKVTVKYNKLKGKNQKLAVSKLIKFKNKGQGTLKYKLASVSKAKFKKYFKVNSKTGKLTIKKGLKKGTYKVKIKVSAAGDVNYKPLTKSVTVKIMVK
ncbi:MAG: cadherin repeat domain-containing protein [Eubacterium sp.]|nr:cadherin repeat domain-containing protein [Eubacterium sp.]